MSLSVTDSGEKRSEYVLIQRYVGNKGDASADYAFFAWYIHLSYLYELEYLTKGSMFYIIVFFYLEIIQELKSCLFLYLHKMWSVI